MIEINNNKLVNVFIYLLLRYFNTKFKTQQNEILACKVQIEINNIMVIIILLLVSLYVCVGISRVDGRRVSKTLQDVPYGGWGSERESTPQGARNWPPPRRR